MKYLIETVSRYAKGTPLNSKTEVKCENKDWISNSLTQHYTKAEFYNEYKNEIGTDAKSFYAWTLRRPHLQFKRKGGIEKISIPDELIKSGWNGLIGAIILSAKIDDDRVFFESDWGNTLMDSLNVPEKTRDELR